MNYEFRVAGTDRWKVVALNAVIAGEIYFWAPTKEYRFLPTKSLTFNSEQLISIQTFMDKLTFERAKNTLTNTQNCDSV